MNFITYIICTTLLFVCAEIAPTSTNQAISSEESNVKESVIHYLSVIFQNVRNWKTPDVDENDKIVAKSEDELLYNVTTVVQRLPSTRVRVMYEYSSDNFKIEEENVSVSFVGYLRDSNNRIGTESLLVHATVLAPKWPNNVIADYHDFNEQNIKLFTRGEKYRPDLEFQIKEKIKTHIKAVFESKTRTQTNDDVKSLFFTPFGFDVFPQHAQNHRYFIDKIRLPSSEYFLSNVIIEGLWNIQNFTIDLFNPSEFLKIQMSGVYGSMVQLFFSKNGKSSRKLSFDAGSVRISTDQKCDRIYFEFERYLVTNSELNRPLSNDQSELIIRGIESEITKSLESSLERLRFLKKSPRRLPIVSDDETESVD